MFQAVNGQSEAWLRREARAMRFCCVIVAANVARTLALRSPNAWLQRVTIVRRASAGEDYSTSFDASTIGLTPVPVQLISTDELPVNEIVSATS